MLTNEDHLWNALLQELDHLLVEEGFLRSSKAWTKDQSALIDIEFKCRDYKFKIDFLKAEINKIVVKRYLSQNKTPHW